MQLTEQLVAVANAYLAAHGKMSSARLSTILFNDGKRLGQIENGRDLTTKTHERAMRWLSDNWPAGAVWPEEIGRPQDAEAA